MPILAREKRLKVCAALVEGNSCRATARMCDVNLRTVLDFGLLLGQGAINFHNAMARDVSTPLVEMDEVWSYIWKKQSRVTPAEDAAGFGEAYNFVGLAMPSRFVVSWTVGKRDSVTCDRFVEDLRSRLVMMPAMTSDGFAPYIGAIGKHFGVSADYAQTVKHYTKGGRRDDDHRYEPPRDPFVTKHVVFGAPSLDEATTAHIERHNGTMRHLIGRMRRLVYAFSKKPENHRAALALAYSYYNFVWIPRGMTETPAMAAKVTPHLYDLPEFMDAILSAEPCERPTACPLASRVPQGPARPLPGGRGFLRLVPGPGGAPTPGPGQGAPPPAPVAPAAPVATVPALPDPSGQLDLFSWKPRTKPLPPKGTQISLFGLEGDPPE